jgi:hypothetical protein
MSILANPLCRLRSAATFSGVLRDFPQDGEGGVIITLGGVEHCFMYTVHDDVVDTVIGPPDYVRQVVNERGRPNR